MFKKNVDNNSARVWCGLVYMSLIWCNLVCPDVFFIELKSGFIILAIVSVVIVTILVIHSP